jgi:hypothetical protein
VLVAGAVTAASRQVFRPTAGPGAQVGASPTKAKSNYVKVRMAGQEIQIDGQTGQIQRLTPEEAQKLAEGLRPMLNKSVEGLDGVNHPDASVSLELQGRFQNVTVARVNKDGTLSQSCVDNPRAAGAFFGIDPKMIEKGPGGKPRINPN